MTHPIFRSTSTFAGFNGVFTGNVTAIGTAVVPVSLYATGLISKDSKMKGTALLAGEAVAPALSAVRAVDIPHRIIWDSINYREAAASLSNAGRSRIFVLNRRIGSAVAEKSGA